MVLAFQTAVAWYDKNPETTRRRAKQARAQQTVDVILEAAAQVLVNDGYAGASTNHIAARAGLSVGTIYQYFANKDELFDALMAREYKQLSSQLAQIEVSRSRPLEDTLREIIEVGVAFNPFGAELYQALEHVPGASFERRIKRSAEAVTDFFVDLLSQHRERLRHDNIEAAAYMAVTCSMGMARTAKAEVFNTYMPAELVDMLIRYLIKDSTDTAT